MLIVCPACASRYELDEAKLGPAGRKVRCAGCQTLWHVEPASEATEFPAAPNADETRALLDEELRRATEIDEQVTAVTAEPGVAQEIAEAEPAAGETGGFSLALARRPRAGRGKAGDGVAGTAWSSGLRLPAGLALGGLICLALLAWKRDLALRAAPQLASTFEKLGLPVNVRGLSLTGIESSVVQDGQGRVLVVEGDVTNIGRGVAKVPLIELAVKDPGGQTLYTWTTEPPRNSLEPAELIHFRARLATPPEAGQTVLVRFSDAKLVGLAGVR